jgi:hypothetical protein
VTTDKESQTDFEGQLESSLQEATTELRTMQKALDCLNDENGCYLEW